MKFKIDYNWFDRGLLFVIILELLALLIVKLMYMPFNKADFHNIIMPIISAAGFIAVIVSIWYVKKGNDERLSQEYHNFYVHKINEKKREAENLKIADGVTTLKVNKTVNILNSYNTIYLLCSNLVGNKEYKDDLKKVDTEKGIRIERTTEDIRFLKVIEKKAYFKIMWDIENTIELVKSYTTSCYQIIAEVRSNKKLKCHHSELAIRRVLRELLGEYLSFSCAIKDGRLTWLNNKTFLQYPLVYGVFDEGFLETYIDISLNKYLNKLYDTEEKLSLLY